MAKNGVLEGVFAINKPYGMSSAQVIRECSVHFNPSALFAPLIRSQASERAREGANQRNRRSKAKQGLKVKMGHGGTLDPLATGVLILGVGKGTKRLGDFLGCTKTYETVVLFGASTDTYDRTGRILKRRSYGELTRATVEAALESFRGKYKQMPPLYSALKIEGKPLYEYARDGTALPREIETRDVEVAELELVEWYEPGSHNHRWPTDEAGAAEQSLAERVWRVEKQQATGKKLSPSEEKDDIAALKAHEDFKRKADEKQDELVYDQPPSKRRMNHTPVEYTMSGALGQLPSMPSSPFHDQGPRYSKKGANLVPPPPGPNTPPPWEGKGPPAAKLRMTVSSGFYVRVMCHELGEKVGSAAMMAELVRTRQERFTLGAQDCLEFGELAKGEEVWAPQVERLLRHWNHTPRVEGEKQKGPTASGSGARSLSPPPETTTKMEEDTAEDTVKMEDVRSETTSGTFKMEGTPKKGKATKTSGQSPNKAKNGHKAIKIEYMDEDDEVEEELPVAIPDSLPTQSSTSGTTQDSKSTAPSTAPSSDPAVPTPKDEDQPAPNEAEWDGFSDKMDQAEEAVETRKVKAT